MCAHGQLGLQPWPRNALGIRCLYHFQALHSSRQQTPNRPDKTGLQLATAMTIMSGAKGMHVSKHDILFLMHTRRQHAQVGINVWCSQSISVLDEISGATAELLSQTCTARFELQECTDHADVCYVQDLCSVFEDQ